MAAQSAPVRLIEVDAENWRSVIEVTPKRGQEEFVAPVANYLCLCHYGGEWHPLAIKADGAIVGHVMWAVDEEDDSVWLGGLVIDATAQGRGYGRAAVLAFLDRFKRKDGGVNAALSYMPDNTVARSLYLDIGFIETGEMEGDEIVARYKVGE